MYCFLVFLTLLAFSSGFPPGLELMRRPRVDDEEPLNGKIVGGTNVTIEQYNYQLALQYGGHYFCGASLLKPDVALTAAHCTLNRNVTNLSVRAGTSIYSSGGVESMVAKIYQHPQFVPRTLDYDMSVLTLKAPLPLSASIGLIALPQPNQVVQPNTMAVVTGYGYLTNIGPIAPQLQAVNLPVMSNAQCKLDYGGSITSRMICAGYASGGKDSCSGDSGGPLVVDGVQVGIVSWGGVCAAPNQPGVYTYVHVLRSWIALVVGV